MKHARILQKNKNIISNLLPFSSLPIHLVTVSKLLGCWSQREALALPMAKLITTTTTTIITTMSINYIATPLTHPTNNYLFSTSCIYS